MKKILNFLKTLLYGIMPAVAGGLIVLSALCIIDNIRDINTQSSWMAILSFVITVVEILLAIDLLYNLGKLQINSNNWIADQKHTESEDIDNKDNSSSDRETSGELVEASSEVKSKVSIRTPNSIS